MSIKILETERLILRKMTHEDAEDLSKILCDPETMRHYPRPLDNDEIGEWIDRNLKRYEEDGHGLWSVLLKDEGTTIGTCGLINQDVDGIIELEVGYLFNKAFWGKGYATEAARGCMDYARNELGRNRIISMIRPVNLPSRRVAERNGLKIEKTLFWRGYQHHVYSYVL